MSGLVVFIVCSWSAFACVLGLSVLIHRSHEREQSARDMLLSNVIREARNDRRRREVERWNRRSIATSGEFEA